MTVHLPKRRFVGKIDWYGGKTKAGKVNEFGFVILLADDDLRKFLKSSGFLPEDSASPISFVVFESEVLSDVSSLEDGCLVTFNLKQGKKGPKAARLCLAEEEIDTDGINAILSTTELDLSIRLKSCLRLHPDPDNDLNALVISTLNEWAQDPYYSNLGSLDEIPSYWLTSDCPYYQSFPATIKAQVFQKKYPDLLDTCNELMQHEHFPSRYWIADYSLLSDQDIELAYSWVIKKANQKQSVVNYEKAKMLSARFAELVVAEFFRSSGDKVEDIAGHQLTGKTDDWKRFDLLIRGSSPVDVKNARRTINGRTFVQYTVKQFKSDSDGKDVKICGVLSPYVKFDDIYSTDTSHGSLIILGQTSATEIRGLEKEFNGQDFKVLFGDSGRWPVWVFDDRPQLSQEFCRAVDNFKSITNQIEIHDWSDCYLKLAPLSILTNVDIPDRYYERFTEWQKQYFAQIRSQRRSDKLSLAWLYLYTFQHFINAMTNMRSFEEYEYSPEGYNQLLFFGSDFSSDAKAFKSNPLGLFDPLHTVSVLINTLNVLWTNRKVASLEALTDFELKAAGLLRARNKDDKLITVLAYCGGFIEKKGSCGNFPLIRGLHETCEACGMLKCDLCNHCSDQCKKQSIDREPGASEHQSLDISF